MGKFSRAKISRHLATAGKSCALRNLLVRPQVARCRLPSPPVPNVAYRLGRHAVLGAQLLALVHATLAEHAPALVRDRPASVNLGRFLGGQLLPF